MSKEELFVTHRHETLLGLMNLSLKKRKKKVFWWALFNLRKKKKENGSMCMIFYHQLITIPPTERRRESTQKFNNAFHCNRHTLLVPRSHQSHYQVFFWIVSTFESP